MWEHEHSSGDSDHEASDAFRHAIEQSLDDPSWYLDEVDWRRVGCRYCGGPLDQLDESGDRWCECGSSGTLSELIVCQRCGWWTILTADFDVEVESETWSAVNRKTLWPTPYERPVAGRVSLEAGCTSGSLMRAKMPADLDRLGVEELQRYILANPDARFLVDPFKFESVVGGVFQNLGRTVVETARSRDGGIDLYLIDDGEGLVAVQVKRYRNRIGVSAIREFRGALLEQPGLAKGVFVTASDFTSGARRAAGLDRPVPIELVDANRLLGAMGCGIRSCYSRDDLLSAPFAAAWAGSGCVSSESWEWDLSDDALKELTEEADAIALGESPDIGTDAGVLDLT